MKRWEKMQRNKKRREEASLAGMMPTTKNRQIGDEVVSFFKEMLDDSNEGQPHECHDDKGVDDGHS